MRARSDRLFEIYLADHLAAATAGVALARRAVRSNTRNGCGETLGCLSAEIEQDRRTLRRIVAELGFDESRAKDAVAWLGEKVGRLKLNGQLRGYSPLSRLLELEALLVGVSGKLALWESMQSLPGIDQRLPEFDLRELRERARRQQAAVEELRLRAAHEALAPAKAKPLGAGSGTA